MMEAISKRGMEAEKPLSKRTVYDGEEVEESSGEGTSEIGTSMKVPTRSMWEAGSIRSTRVPGGYNSSTGGILLQ